jgi:Methyltransferase domain
MENQLKKIAEDVWLTQVQNYVPSAWIGHAPFLRFLIRELKPKVFVELGTHNGFSYFVACQTVKELGLSTKTYAVDHWLGDPHAGNFDDSVYMSVVEINRQYETFSTLLKMSFSEARAEIQDGAVNLLHIDGFHTYEAVKEDFETWLPKVNQSGVIILHDIHVRHANFGVYKYWAEVKQKYQTMEFVGSYGLGVVFLGEVNSAALSNLRDCANSGQLAQVQGVFGGLSDATLQHYRVVEKSKLEEKMNLLTHEITRDDTEISRLNHEVAQLNIEMSTLLNSKSWKITVPLRKLARFIQRKP